MRNPEIRRPTYALASVDNALSLLQMLRDEGSLRIKDAAARLGIAPSTAHRLLSMLAYRGFAVQDETRRYLPGPAMGVGPANAGWTRRFHDLCQEHLEVLSARSGETVNLVIRVGTQVRFLTTVESSNILRVGDRRGQVLPALHTSGGRVLLADLPRAALESLYLARDDPEDGMPPQEFESMTDDLASIKRLGYAVNVEQTEEGVTAYGVALRNGAGVALGALSVAIPATRFGRYSDGRLLGLMRSTAREIEVDIADIDP